MIKMKNPENKVEWKTFDGVMDPKDILIFTLRFSVPKNELNNMRRYINGNSIYRLVKKDGIYYLGIEDEAAEDIKKFFQSPKKGIIRLPNGWIKFFRSAKYIVVYWVDDEGTHTEKFDDWKSIATIAKEEIARKNFSDDINFGNELDYERILKILKRIPGFREVIEEFKNTHHYFNRRDLLRNRLSVGIIYEPLKDDIGIYEVDTNDMWDIRCKYKDSRYDSIMKISWYDLEKYLYDKLEMHDVVGQETYTEEEVLKEAVSELLNKYKDRVEKFKEEFINCKGNDRIDIIKKYCGGVNYGWGSPMHKHEYGVCGQQNSAKNCEISWKDVNGRHEKSYKWKEVADMFDKMLKDK